MPGYLRPRIQTIFPGPNNPKFTLEQNGAGGEGSYWIEFTFQPNPALKTNIAEEEVRSGLIGDSHLVLSAPLPEGIDRKHTFTVKHPKEELEYFIYCNARGRLSHVNFRCRAEDFSSTIAWAKKNFEPFLSGWSARFNTPLYVFRIRAMEESSNIVKNILYYQAYPEIEISLEEMSSAYWFPEDMRALDFYREALNATSPKYQFLCYYKVVELVITLRAKRDSDARKKGKTIKRTRDLLVEENWFLMHLTEDMKPLVLGKKYTSILDDILRPVRNKIAHALMRSCAHRRR